jgi:competence protein ComEC
VGIILKNGNQAVVLSDLKITDKTYLYSIQPYLDSCRVEGVKLYDLNSDINTPWLKKRYNLAQFLNTNIFIFNGQLKNNALSHKLKTNYVYITGNPDDGLEALNNNFVYSTLIIDGTNSDRLINNWGRQVTDEHINYKILKRNKSIISVSN